MKKSSKSFIKSEKHGWTELSAGVKRKITGFDDHVMMVLVKFDKGGVGEPHSHPHSQTTYVESGEFRVTIGDEEEILKKGDCFYAPPGVTHGVVCLSEGTLIDVFSPMREDFL